MFSKYLQSSLVSYHSSMRQSAAYSFLNNRSISFVPSHRPPKEEDIDIIANFILSSNNLFILTGAGVSTESGIPDYRSEGVGLYARSNSRPVQFRDFLRSEAARKRYWARNYVGWPRFSSFSPNASHYAISDLENKGGRVSCVVTQNVDGLHSKAGSNNLIELHGTAFRVVCLECGSSIERHAFQNILSSLNPQMRIMNHVMRPDGDVEMKQEDVEGFTVPACHSCGGILKPDIVFFGDNVPRARVEDVKRQVKICDAILVLGSTLTVFSAYRIILQAAELGKPIAIVNIGETRGDKHACIKVNAKCGDIIPKLL